jgi:uncharacterized membrane protein YqhA
MVAFFRALRYILLLAAFGLLLGSLLMFWEGLLMLWEGYEKARFDSDTSVIVTVLQATDKLLLGVVLMVVACAIALGFALNLTAEQRTTLPQWMIIDTVAELKNLFFQVIILYVVVHFAALVGEAQSSLDWNVLVLPVSALLLAGAMKLVASSSHLSDSHPASEEKDPLNQRNKGR